jgi:hypothetical protein
MKHRMLTRAHHNVQIASRAAKLSGIAFACQSNALSVPRSGFDTNVYWFGTRHDTFAVADWAYILRLAGAAAARTLQVEPHVAAHLCNLSLAVTFGTSAHTLELAASVAIAAGFLPLYVDAHHGAANGVPESDVDLIFQIGAGLDLSLFASATRAAEDAGEYVPESAATTLATALLLRPLLEEVAEIEAAEINRDTLSAACTAEAPIRGLSAIRTATRAGVASAVAGSMLSE